MQVQTIRTRVARSALLVCGLLLSGLLACSTRSELKGLRPASDLMKPRMPQVQARRFEDPGRIMLLTERLVCGESQDAETINLAGSESLPDFADRATVILNGWRFRYLRKDHHLRGVGAVILKIARSGSELTWSALGDLYDRNGDDPFEFCYVYTVVAWNSASIDIDVDHEDVSGSEGIEPFYNGAPSDGDTPLGSVTSYRFAPGAEDGDQVAILPRGFLTEFSHRDRHLLQLSYVIDHREIIVEKDRDYGVLDPPPGVAQGSRRSQGVPSWDTSAILKDNARAQRHAFVGQFTSLWGSDAALIQPPFSVRPGRTPGLIACGGAAPPLGTKRQSVVIRDLPFDYAIPLLTGWDLDYVCEDEHVTELGIWLEDVEFDKEPDDPLGTLRFTVASVQRDKDSRPPHTARFKVDVLGLNSSPATDLIPTSADSQLCERDPSGNLVITVANVGEGDARPSTTQVRFGTESPDEIRTPALRKGSSLKVGPFEIPASCGSDCPFTVRVDANGEVTESNEDNNRSKGVCIG